MNSHTRAIYALQDLLAMCARVVRETTETLLVQALAPVLEPDPAKPEPCDNQAVAPPPEPKLEDTSLVATFTIPGPDLPKKGKKKRKISAAGRKAISAAAKARWKKIRAAK